jgi:drug/metabolite transporter (DMT)-like permease
MSNWMLFVVTVAVWGSTWLAIEYQLGDVAPAVSIVYRYVVASALLFAWCIARGLNLGFDLRAHSYFALLGLLLFSLNYVLTYHAQQLITSALAAVAFSMMLWMNIVNARMFFGMRAGKAVVGGSVLGISGIVVLFLPEVGRLSPGDATLFGTGLAVIGAFIASLGNMVSQAAQKHGLPVLQSNAWGMFYGAVLSAIVAVGSGEEFTFDGSPGYLLSLGYLAVFGSIIGFGTYLTLLGRVGAAKAGYAMVAFPVVAIVLSVIAGETEPGWNLVAGGLLVLSGNVFVLRSRQSPPQKSTERPPDQPVAAVLAKPR